MELQYYGANCIKISTKKATVVVDDNLAAIGGKSIIREGDCALFTGAAPKQTAHPKIVIDMPGEYEISGVSIYGIAARAHIDTEDQQSATMYRIIADDVRIGVVGHIYPSLSEEQLEALGTIDVLVIPVGGHGYTLDPTGALQVIKKVEPKIVVPTQYADDKLSYEVPAIDLDAALKALGMEPKESVDKLKIKGSDLFSDQTQLVVLNRQ